MGRLGEPDDIAEVVAFLAGPGRWINGQVIDADGGLQLTPGSGPRASVLETCVC